MDFFPYFYHLQITKHESKKTVHSRVLLNNQGKFNIQHSCQLLQPNKVDICQWYSTFVLTDQSTSFMSIYIAIDCF